MEALLKISGLLADDDGGKTDLGTLEKMLADKASPKEDSSQRNSLNPLSGAGSCYGTPQHQEVHSSLGVPLASPDAEKEKQKKKGEEVEALSDMMCSLVTNNCGETKFIGISTCGFNAERADRGRFLFWLLHIFA